MDGKTKRPSNSSGRYIIFGRVPRRALADPSVRATVLFVCALYYYAKFGVVARERGVDVFVRARGSIVVFVSIRFDVHIYSAPNVCPRCVPRCYKTTVTLNVFREQNNDTPLRLRPTKIICRPFFEFHARPCTFRSPPRAFSSNNRLRDG